MNKFKSYCKYLREYHEYPTDINDLLNARTEKRKASRIFVLGFCLSIISLLITMILFYSAMLLDGKPSEMCIFGGIIMTIVSGFCLFLKTIPEYEYFVNICNGVFSKYNLTGVRTTDNFINHLDYLKKSLSTLKQIITEKEYLDKVILKSNSLSTYDVEVLNLLVIEDNAAREILNDNLYIKESLTISTE